MPSLQMDMCKPTHNTRCVHTFLPRLRHRRIEKKARRDCSGRATFHNNCSQKFTLLLPPRLLPQVPPAFRRA